MVKKNNLDVIGKWLRIGLTVITIVSLSFIALEAYIINKYETKENYELATMATKEVVILRKEIYIRLDKIEDDLHRLDIDIKVLQERVKILPS